MKPTKPQAISSPPSTFEFFNPEFEAGPHFKLGNAEESIASLREENEKLRRIAAMLEQQTKSMRATWDATWEKPKPR